MPLACLLHLLAPPIHRYSRNAWGFGWYRRYKRNYAAGWSRPGKFIGHRRHLLQDQQDDMLHQHQQLQQWHAAGRSSGLRRLMDLQGDVTPAINASQLQNETIMIPPCLLSSTYYKNTCKQCNYSRLGVKLSVGVVRRGFLNRTAGANPLGFTAPSIAVTPGGVIIITTGYSGPSNHPSSSAPAYPGESAAISSDSASCWVNGGDRPAAGAEKITYKCEHALCVVDARAAAQQLALAGPRL